MTLHLQQIDKNSVLLALGSVAHAAELKTFGLKLKDYKFVSAEHIVLSNGFILYDSYHCSRYNTQAR